LNEILDYHTAWRSANGDAGC